MSNSKSYDPWILEYTDYNVKKEKSREALLTVGNGYFGTRGALEETKSNKNNYPGTYISGLYNRSISKVGDRDVENEDFVNCPNWVPVTFKIGNDSWFRFNQAEVESIKRQLNFKNGTLYREVIVKDKAGNETQITSLRFASMDNCHLGAIKYTIKPLNYSGEISVKSTIDGDIINEGVERYSDLNQHHLEQVEEKGEGNQAYVVVQTTHSKIKIAEAASLKVCKNDKPIDVKFDHKLDNSKVSSTFKIHLKENDELTIEKTVGIYTSKNDDVKEPLEEAKKLIDKAVPFDELLEKSNPKWDELWKNFDIEIEGDSYSQMLMRMHIYHLLITSSPHNVNIDFGIPARGLHGEAYRGHIFWDELYILPMYSLAYPEIAKSILMYRYRRLEYARDYATGHGYEGAMFPWQSGSDGREETQIVHLNPISGEWGDDYSSLQRHISIAVAYNTWMYYWITNDIKFMEEYGAEMFLEICRFWASKCEFNTNKKRYEIKMVMGPDEFHEKYPGSDDGGIKDNAYTNIMVVWLFQKAAQLLNDLPDNKKNEVISKISLEDKELKKWHDVTTNINIIIDDEDIISQFDGYFNLHELDWDEYREKYKNIHRLDRILKAEGLSPDDYKLAKQADTLMTFYTIDAGDIKGILYDLGYFLSDDFLSNNFHYYINRTSHGSTLSRVVHAYLANIIGNFKLGWDLYKAALESDYNDIQGGTTAEGIHAGVMGGTVLMAINSFAGINYKHKYISIKPCLPECWKRIAFNFTFREKKYIFDISHQEIKVTVQSHKDSLVKLTVLDEEKEIETNKETIFNY